MRNGQDVMVERHRYPDSKDMKVCHWAKRRACMVLGTHLLRPQSCLIAATGQRILCRSQIYWKPLLRDVNLQSRDRQLTFTVWSSEALITLSVRLNTAEFTALCTGGMGVVRNAHQLNCTSLLCVALEHVDRVNGRGPEVPETKRGVM